jgi:hypothetical protein
MPRQVFTAGEILTAANMNDLSDQAVMVFDDSAARGSAIPTPSEGMVTYLKDTDTVEVYDGSAFGTVGGLVEVKSAIFTGTQVASSIAAGGNVAVTDLSITHEVANSSNKLIISAFIGVAGNSNQLGDVGLAVHDGTGLIAVGDTAGSRTRLTAGGRAFTASSTQGAAKPSVTFVHTPGAGSKTYTVRAINTEFTSQTLYINRTERNDDGVFIVRGVSSLVIQEVAV